MFIFSTPHVSEAQKPYTFHVIQNNTQYEQSMKNVDNTATSSDGEEALISEFIMCWR